MQDMLTFDLENYGSTITAILGPAEGGTRLMPLAPAGPWRHDGWEAAQELIEGGVVRSAAGVGEVRSVR